MWRFLPPTVGWSGFVVFEKYTTSRQLWLLGRLFACIGCSTRPTRRSIRQIDGFLFYNIVLVFVLGDRWVTVRVVRRWVRYRMVVGESEVSFVLCLGAPAFTGGLWRFDQPFLYQVVPRLLSEVSTLL